MEQEPRKSHARLVLALEGMEGVGRVTTRKILKEFPDLQVIRTLPREQVLNRLKGVPNTAKLLEKLADDAYLNSQFREVSKRIESWAERRVWAATFLDDDWPGGLDRLPNPHRPTSLFGYGVREELNRPRVAIVSPRRLEETSFEMAQRLIRLLLDEGAAVSMGLSSGLDVVAIKLNSEKALPALALAASGLAKIEQRMRPHASQIVKSNGLILSSFAMDHGPFEHDRKEVSHVQTALARAVVFVEPDPEGLEWPALEWSLTQRMPVFGISSSQLPDRVHMIRHRIDMEWVLAAVRHVGP